MLNTYKLQATPKEPNPYVDATLSPKWDSVTGSMQPDPILPKLVAANLPGVTLAFITAQTDATCQAAWGGYGDYSVKSGFGVNAIKELQKAGKKSIISFGGAFGTYLEKSCQTSKDLSLALKQVINTYQVKDLDFDIEGGNLADTASITRLAISLAELQASDASINISVTLPVLPEGLTQEGINAIKIWQQHNVKFNVNIMTMDYGDHYQGSMGDLTIQAMKSTQQQLTVIYPTENPDTLWQRLIVTPMIGVNDVQVEHFTLEDATVVAKFAHDKKSGYRYWDLNRDHPCDQPYADITCSGAYAGQRMQTNDFDYAKKIAAVFALGLMLSPTPSDSHTAGSSNSWSDTLLIVGMVVLGIFAIGGLSLMARNKQNTGSCFKFFKPEEAAVPLTQPPAASEAYGATMVKGPSIV